MKKIKLLLQYDGTNYFGWQRQPDRPSIQGTIEKALYEITGKKTNLTASGRTDRGVHALGQVAVFKTTTNLSPKDFQNALNSLLPPDIRVLYAEEVPEDFNPRFGVKRKRYIYLINRAEVQSPFLYRYTYHWRGPLDTDAMKRACSVLLGTKDFRAFQSAGSSVKTTVRTLFEATIQQMSRFYFLAFSLEGPLLVFSFEADGFLKQMVRNIVGTLLEVGKGALPPEEIERILASGDRKQAGPTVPANGLFLERVIY
ncbi:MAG: tRNA pseudouridine(38-40) synthase TruA [Nitrospirae bacterium]|nr:MAG: tRNA pseudouridine(38-40) synthase TruA [Nitrospirota bacterium]